MAEPLQWRAINLPTLATTPRLAGEHHSDSSVNLCPARIQFRCYDSRPKHRPLPDFNSTTMSHRSGGNLSGHLKFLDIVSSNKSRQVSSFPREHDPPTTKPRVRSTVTQYSCARTLHDHCSRACEIALSDSPSTAQLDFQSTAVGQTYSIARLSLRTI